MVRYCTLLNLFKDYYTYSDIAISYSRASFFSSESLKRNKMLSLHLDLKITFNLQYGKFPLIVRLSHVLKSSKGLPKYSKTQINF